MEQLALWNKEDDDESNDSSKKSMGKTRKKTLLKELAFEHIYRRLIPEENTFVPCCELCDDWLRIRSTGVMDSQSRKGFAWVQKSKNPITSLQQNSEATGEAARVLAQIIGVNPCAANVLGKLTNLMSCPFGETGLEVLNACIDEKENWVKRSEAAHYGINRLVRFFGKGLNLTIMTLSFLENLDDLGAVSIPLEWYIAWTAKRIIDCADWICLSLSQGWCQHKDLGSLPIIRDLPTTFGASQTIDHNTLSVLRYGFIKTVIERVRNSFSVIASLKKKGMTLALEKTSYCKNKEALFHIDEVKILPDTQRLNEEFPLLEDIILERFSLPLEEKNRKIITEVITRAFTVIKKDEFLRDRLSQKCQYAITKKRDEDMIITDIILRLTEDDLLEISRRKILDEPTE